MKKLDTEYTLLFNGITDTLQELEGLKQRLEALQLAAEKIVMEKGEAEEDRLMYVGRETREVS